MNKFFASTIVVASLLVAKAKAQVSMPQPSPTQTISQEFGMGSIKIVYSRPSIKGRNLFGEGSELAPLGKVWRTGANSATKITFTDNVIIGGKTLDTGSYVIYTKPMKDQWEIILNKGTANWGTDGHKESDDVVHTMVPSMKMKESVETFTIQIANIKAESCELHLMWGNTAVAVPITTKIKDRLRTQIEKALDGEKKPYSQAANFYYEWDKNYDKALENINKAIEANPKGFWLYLTRAKIRRDMGDKAGARRNAEKTIEIATEEKNEDYVRMAKELISKL